MPRGGTNAYVPTVNIWSVTMVTLRWSESLPGNLKSCQHTTVSDIVALVDTDVTYMYVNMFAQPIIYNIWNVHILKAVAGSLMRSLGL